MVNDRNPFVWHDASKELPQAVQGANFVHVLASCKSCEEAGLGETGLQILRYTPKEWKIEDQDIEGCKPLIIKKGWSDTVNILGGLVDYNNDVHYWCYLPDCPIT